LIFSLLSFVQLESRLIRLLLSKFAQHRFPEHAVHPSLVALPLFAEPSDYIGVKAHRQLLFHGLVKRIANRICPEILGQRWDVEKVDLRIGGFC